jgi:putative transposase
LAQKNLKPLFGLDSSFIQQTLSKAWIAIVDTLGLLMMVVVTAVNLNDCKGATMVLEKLNEIRDRFPRLSGIWVDRGYNGKAFIKSGRWLNVYFICLVFSLSPFEQRI